MGKPKSAALGEIDKSITHIRYYIDHAVEFTQEEGIKMMNGSYGRIRI
jgi:hypothetical protein